MRCAADCKNGVKKESYQRNAGGFMFWSLVIIPPFTAWLLN